MAQTILNGLLVLAVLLALGGIPIALMWSEGRTYRVARADDPPEKKRLERYIKIIGVLLLLIGATSAVVRWLFPS